MARKATPKPEPEPTKRIILSVKGSRAYEEWLEQIVELANSPKVWIARQALREWAEKRGYPAPPKE